MIDIHCHILPGIDDGPQEMEESVEMARIAHLDGIKIIVATPHLKDSIYPVEVIAQKAEEFSSILTDRGIPLQIMYGADVNALLNPSHLLPYTINGTEYILIEFPHTYLPRNAREIIFKFMVEGFMPIVTHPERNISVLQDPSLLMGLLESGALCQITADSLTGFFGPQVRECAIHLLKKDAVHFIASDAHSKNNRKPRLSHGLEAASSIIGKERAMKLVMDNPEAVVRGIPLDID